MSRDSASSCLETASNFAVALDPSQPRTMPATETGRNASFRGDKPGQNGDNPLNACSKSLPREISSVIASRTSALIVAGIAGGILLAPVRAHAQWWRGAPADFEDCADAAEKAKTREVKTSALAECNAKFAGRRKVGGGYTYYDFMQDRTFDIAGPNPTPEEQKKIDEQYTSYLEKQRRNTIAAALMAKQQQKEEPPPPPPTSLQQVSLRSEPPKVPVPVANPLKQAEMRARIKAANCVKGSFSCDWPRLSESLNELKRMFNPPPNTSKAKRS
jgi:hypothetical protein